MYKFNILNFFKEILIIKKCNQMLVIEKFLQKTVGIKKYKVSQ